jgi:benzoate membrane transport protein
MISELKQDLSPSAMLAGILAVAVSFGGPAAIIFQAADAAHLDNGQLMSWIWAVSIGSGLAGIYLSYRLKTPVITAWSTPGAALLVTGWSAYSYPEAIGCFLFSGTVIMFFGITGWFSTIMERIPKAIVAAMLAGILFRFGVDVFIHLEAMPILVAPMILCFLIFKRVSPRYAIMMTLIVGFLVAYAQGRLHFGQIEASLAIPHFTAPLFTLRAIVGLGIPLSLVTMAGQNATGLAVIRAAGYGGVPASPMIIVTGLISVLMAPFGAHGINLAAITAAICTGPEAHPNSKKRYPAGIICGLFYILVGSFGATLVGLFMALPAQLIAVIAGLALMGALISGLSQAMADEKQKQAALVTFLVTVSGLTVFGIGSAFWGLVGGLFCSMILTGRLSPKARFYGEGAN